MALEHQLTAYRSDIPTVLRNVSCPYCGKFLASAKDWNIEHVIGRKFVPKGMLNKQWNLILRSCRECNSRKSELEDDIGAISMQRSGANASYDIDDTLRRELDRRAMSFSRKTGRPVSESGETIDVELSTGSGIPLFGKLEVPPQIDDVRLFELARLQLAGFFYALTFRQESQRGGFWVGGFYPLLEATRSDWGNVVHKAFMLSVRDWEPRLLCETATSHYKVVIRRHPDADCWGWALEWNCNYRIVGFFGKSDVAQAIVKDLPPIPLVKLAENEKDWLAIRTDVGISDSEDVLFVWDGPTRDSRDNSRAPFTF